MQGISVDLPHKPLNEPGEQYGPRSAGAFAGISGSLLALNLGEFSETLDIGDARWTRSYTWQSLIYGGYNQWTYPEDGDCPDPNAYLMMSMQVDAFYPGNYFPPDPARALTTLTQYAGSGWTWANYADRYQVIVGHLYMDWA